jgi:hypothetical protein
MDTAFETDVTPLLFFFAFRGEAMDPVVEKDKDSYHIRKILLPL